MRRTYSRLARVEEKKNIKKAILFGILTILALIAFMSFGIPILARFTSFLVELKKSNILIEKNDTTAPAPPRINSYPESTNKSSLELTGSTEPSATAVVNLNGKENEVLTNNEGEFSFNLILNKGENTFFLFASDASGNKSQYTQEFKVVVDMEPPEIMLESPADGSTFYGTKQRQIVIKGKTEKNTNLTVNGRFVIVGDNGSFLFATTLTEGENVFNIKTIDKADNTTEKTLTLFFHL